MNTRLLKINAMKRFAKWLDINHVHPDMWDEWMYYEKVWNGLERRQQQAYERDRFCRDRKRPSFKRLAYDRVNQFIQAQELLTKIKKRYEYK